MIVWLVGLSGAGKTTIARQLHRQWQAREPATVLIDGDEIREIFKHDQNAAAYTPKGRRINAERITAMSTWLDRQNINAVVSILCIFPDILAANRGHYKDYYEVFIDAPLDQLEARDSKGLYAAARAGEMSDVVSIDIPFPTSSPSAPCASRACFRSLVYEIQTILTSSEDGKKFFHRHC